MKTKQFQTKLTPSTQILPLAFLLQIFRARWVTIRPTCMSALPASEVIIGCNFRVAKVYTWPVSEATRSITWVPVNVESSYA